MDRVVTPALSQRWSRCSVVAVLGFGFATGCGPGEPGADAIDPPSDPNHTLVVFSVSEPIRYFAQRIGGDRVDVRFPITAGVDPAEWSPTPEVIARYQAADRILLNGGGYAAWVARASLPRRALVDTSAEIRSQLLPVRDAVRHSHGPEGAHAHAAVAGTTWLDPEIALGHARAIATAFSAARPAHAAEFEAGLRSLARDLAELDARFEAAAASLGKQPLVFSHPVYRYFIARYDLNARSLHWEPDETPTEEMWASFRRQQVDHPARFVLWEARPKATTAAALRDLGVRSVVFETVAAPSETGDFLERMQANAAAFEALGVNPIGVSGVEIAE